MADIYSVQFDEINDYFDITDDSDLNIILSNGSQFYAFWLEVDNNTGSLFQYWFSNSTNNNNAGALNLIINEESHASADLFLLRPDSGTFSATSTAQSFPTGRILVVAQYNSSSTRFELSICPEGGTNSRFIGSSGVVNNITSTFWELGRRGDGNADRYYGGKIANFAKGTGLPSNADIETLADDLLLYDRDLLDTVATADIFFPMNEGAGTTITDDVIGLTASGIGFPGNDSQWILEGSTGGITVTGSTANYNYSGITGTVDLTGEIIVTGGTANYDYSGIPGSIEIGAEIIVVGQTANYDYSAINGTVELTGLITVTGQTANYDYDGIAADIILQGSIIVTGSTANYDYNALNGTIILQGPITVNPRNIIRVNRKSNTIRVKRSSNILRVR